MKSGIYTVNVNGVWLHLQGWTINHSPGCNPAPYVFPHPSLGCAVAPHGVNSTPYFGGVITHPIVGCKLKPVGIYRAWAHFYFEECTKTTKTHI